MTLCRLRINYATDDTSVPPRTSRRDRNRCSTNWATSARIS